MQGVNRLYVSGVAATGEEEVKRRLAAIAPSSHFALERARTGEPRNYGFASFDTQEQAHQALAILRGLNVHGQRINAVLDRNAAVSQLVAVHVGSLHVDATDSMVHELFPAAESVKVVCDRLTKASRGYAFANFKSTTEAQEAIDTRHNFEFMGMRLRVTLKRTEPISNSVPPKQGRLREEEEEEEGEDVEGDENEDAGESEGVDSEVNDGEEDVGKEKEGARSRNSRESTSARSARSVKQQFQWEVFIGNLAPVVKRRDLVELCKRSGFSTFGVYMKRAGRAFVHFPTSGDANMAAKLWHKLNYKGQVLTVVSKRRDVSVLVENISQCLSKSDVEAMLRALPCRKHQVPTNQKKEHVGRAILYGTPAQAAEFIEKLNGKTLGELSLRAYMNDGGEEDYSDKQRREKQEVELRLREMKLRRQRAAREQMEQLVQKFNKLKRTAEEKAQNKLRKLEEEAQLRKERQELADLRERYRLLMLDKEIAKSKAEVKRLKEKEKISEKEQADLAKREKELEEKRRLKSEAEMLRARCAMADIELDTAPVDWNAAAGWRAAEAATVIEFGANLKVNGELEPLRERARTAAVVQVKQRPFGRGTFRFAFHAKITLAGQTAPLRMVAKSAIGARGSEEDKADCLEDLETQVIAAELARRYSARKELSKRLEFVEPVLIHFHERASSSGPNAPLYMVAEPVLMGKWQRFTNNSKHVAQEAKYATVLAFSHFTHQVTKGRMMVVDLQGNHETNAFKLTDPAIHHPSDLGKFGGANRGDEGIDDFFESHQCNQLCKALSLSKHPKQMLDDHVTDTVVRPGF